MNALPEYLGEGVYASFDANLNLIWLLVEHETNDELKTLVRLERIALDTTAFSALLRFADRCWPQPEVTYGEEAEDESPPQGDDQGKTA